MNAPILLERDHTSLTLAWTKVEHAECYELELSADNGDWLSLSNGLKSTNIRKKNLMNEVSYRFRIRYKIQDDMTWSSFSPPSDDYRVLAPDVLIMNPPEITTRDDVSVTLLWTEVAGAEGYMLRYRSDEDAITSGDTCWSKIDTVIKSNTVRKKGLKSGVNYQFSVLPVGFPESDVVWAYSPSSTPCKVLTMPPFMQKLFPTKLISGNGTLIPACSVLTGKCVAIYFSAHWCGPCRQFTPKLLDLYAQCKAAGKRFEIIFCSADNSEEEFRNYHAGMSWPAIGYDEEHREGMMGMFKVSGIPRMVVLAPSGRIVVENAISGAPLTTATVDQWISMSDNMK